MRLDKITLRAICKEDEQLIFQLFTLSRPDLDGLVGIDEKVKAEIIYGQYRLEQNYLYSEYPEAELNMILYMGESVGRLYTYYGESAIRIIAISLLPEYREKGIGNLLISNILNEAACNGKNVCLNVMWYNHRAYALYEKLGFKVAEDKGVSCEMQWTPASVFT